MLVLVLGLTVMPVVAVHPAAAVGPTLASLTPASGSVSGGDSVTLSGTGFIDGQTTVTFGGEAATSVTVSDADTLEVELPPSPGLAVGRVDVVVEVEGSATAPASFTYRPALSLYREEHVTLGELASRSQRQPVSRTETPPYLVFGTDALSDEPYVYETDYDYVNWTTWHSAYLRESDERALDPSRIGGLQDFRGSVIEHASLAAVTRGTKEVIDPRDGVLEMQSYAWCAGGNTFDGITTYCSVFGPEVYTEPFFARADQALAFDWAANRVDDDYEIYAFLVAVDDPAISDDIPEDVVSHTLIAHGQGWDQNWTTATGDIPADGYYRFRFVNGSYDGTGGTLVGSNMYIDDIVLVGLQNTISFPDVGDQVGADSQTFDVSPVTATSGAEVAVTSVTPGVCSVSTAGDVVTVEKLQTGVCTLRAIQGAVGDYAPAATVTRSFEILAQAVAPSAPLITSVAAGTDHLDVVFQPGADGGAPITHYEYSLDGGSTWVTPDPAVTASPLLIAGLTPNTVYEVRIRAVNEQGAGGASAVWTRSTEQLPPPDAPALSVTAGDGSLALTITTQDAATNVAYRLDGGEWITRQPASMAMPWTITGLTNGQAYDVEARVLNGDLVGAGSAVVSATPVAPPRRPAPAPAPEPSPDPEPAPDPDPVPDPAPAPAPAPAPDPQPAPEPEPVPQPAPEPVRSETGALPGSDVAEVEVDGARQSVVVEPGAGGGVSVVADGFVLAVRPATTPEDAADDTDGSSGTPGSSPGGSPGAGSGGDAPGDSDAGEDAASDVDLVFTRGRAAQVSARGFAAGSEVRLWLFSEPRLLGVFETDEFGDLEALTAALGDEVSACAHTLHAEGTLSDGRRVRMSLGVWVDADPYPFADVAAGSVHRRAIGCLQDTEVVRGVADGRYDPSGVTTRGQAATMLARWFGLRADGQPTHEDARASVHGPAIAALVESGVAQGFDAQRFGPQEPVTRGQFASMLAGLLALPAAETAAFTDAGGVHDGAIAALARLGVVMGFEDGSFRADDPVTRAQLASIIVRQQLAMR